MIGEMLMDRVILCCNKESEIEIHVRAYVVDGKLKI